MKKINLEGFLQDVSDLLADANKTLNGFTKAMSEDPANFAILRLKESESAFTAAARVRVWTEVANLSIDNAEELMQLQALASRRVLDATLSPCRSTSVFTKLTEELTAMAWAEVLQRVNIYIENAR